MFVGCFSGTTGNDVRQSFLSKSELCNAMFYALSCCVMIRVGVFTDRAQACHGERPREAGQHTGVLRGVRGGVGVGVF
jgi:hypothetical protein